MDIRAAMLMLSSFGGSTRPLIEKKVIKGSTYVCPVRLRRADGTNHERVIRERARKLGVSLAEYKSGIYSHKVKNEPKLV